MDNNLRKNQSCRNRDIWIVIHDRLFRTNGETWKAKDTIPPNLIRKKVVDNVGQNGDRKQCCSKNLIPLSMEIPPSPVFGLPFCKIYFQSWF